MSKRISKYKYPVIVFALLIVLLLAGCDGMGQKTRKPPGDFSRGLPISTEATSPPAAAINSDGSLVQVIVPILDENAGNAFRFVQIDQSGRILTDADLALDLAPYLRSPLMINNGEELHLLWAARESTKEGWQLWHAILNTDGEITSSPKWISKGTDRVSKYSATGDSLGNLTVVWEDSDSHSVLITRLSGEGDIISSPEVLILEGEIPALIADDGGIHLSWMDDGRLFYAEVQASSSLPVEGLELTRIQVALGNRLDGPVIGISDTHVFLFWSILRQVGLEAGTAISESLVFPKGEPSLARRDLLPIFPVSEDLLEPYQGTLSLSQAIPAPPEDYLTTENILDPRTLTSSFHGVQVVAVSASQTMRLDSHMQIIIGIFEGGTYQNYVVGSHTTEISQNPLIFLDSEKYLHLIWQEGFFGEGIYYATTAPEAKARLDRIAFGDFPNLILAGGLEAVAGILLFPFALPWVAVGLVIMIVLRLSRNDEEVTQPLSTFLVVIALLSYQASKLLFLPDILVYIPFSAWLDIPEGLGMALRIAIPIIIILIGIGVAEWRRRGEKPLTSSLGYYMTAVIVDTVLTLSIYGVIFMGEY